MDKFINWGSRWCAWILFPSFSNIFLTLVSTVIWGALKIPSSNIIKKSGRYRRIKMNIKKGNPLLKTIYQTFPDFFFKRIRLLIFFSRSSGSWYFFQAALAPAPAPRGQKNRLRLLTIGLSLAKYFLMKWQHTVRNKNASHISLRSV